MFDLVPYLLCLEQHLSKTLWKQLLLISQSMFCCTGRITMLSLSRWSQEGASYRTLQRFYHSSIDWVTLNWNLFFQHEYHSQEVYLLSGDETIATKAGTKTYGLGKFFSSIHSRAVKSVSFFSVSLIGVSEGTSSPLLMKQLDPDMKKQIRSSKDTPKKTGKKGRPKGSKNKNRKLQEKTPYLQWMQEQIQSTLKVIGNKVSLSFFVYDGAFGNNECLSMVKDCGLSLISKLHCNAALYFPYEGPLSKGKKKKKYGVKVNYDSLPLKYLQQHTKEKKGEEWIYQFTALHKDFYCPLNITVIQRRKKNGKIAQVILFSDDLDLPSEKMILYYRLRFQIEFNFRDAKQFFGLEDFMNIKKEAVTNAANLSMFMVNFSQIVLKKVPEEAKSIADLKSRSQSLFYLDRVIKIEPQIQKVISFKRIKKAITDIGCIHQYEKAA